MKKILICCAIILLTIALIPPVMILTSIVCIELEAYRKSTLTIYPQDLETNQTAQIHEKIRSSREAILYAIHAGMLENVDYKNHGDISSENWRIEADNYWKTTENGLEEEFWEVNMWKQAPIKNLNVCTLTIKSTDGFKPPSKENHELTCFLEQTK